MKKFLAKLSSLLLAILLIAACVPAIALPAAAASNLSTMRNVVCINTINGTAPNPSILLFPTNDGTMVYTTSADTLLLQGWAVVEGGQGAIFYSYDGGNTWTQAITTRYDEARPGYWDGPDIVSSCEANNCPFTATAENVKFNVTVPVPGTVGTTTNIILARESLAQPGTYSKLFTIKATKTGGQNVVTSVNGVNRSKNTFTAIVASTVKNGTIGGYTSYDASTLPAMTDTHYNLWGWAIATGGQGDGNYLYFSVDGGVTWTMCTPDEGTYTLDTGTFDCGYGEYTDSTAIVQQAPNYSITNASAGNERFFWVGADLSAYTGRTVDMVIGFKTTDGKMTPMFEINNISVPGEAKPHTCTDPIFYSTDRNNATHSGTCMSCHLVITESCTVNSVSPATGSTHTGTCTVCNGTVTSACTASEGWLSNESGHWKTCTECSQALGTPAAHTTADNTPCTDELYCTECEYGMGKGPVHSYGDWSVTKPATCTEAGEMQRVCSGCGDTETEAVEINPDNHSADVISVEAKDPTCVDEGYEAYEYCPACDYTTYVRIPATGVHNWDDGVVTTEPTCTKEGVRTFTCGVCEATETEPVAVTDHIYDGNADLECNECGATRDCPHDYDNACDADCNICGDERVPAEHVEEIIPGTPATCHTTGLSDGVKCSVCDKVLKEQTVTDTLSHNYVTNKVEATCTTRGYTLYECTNCDNEYMTDYVDSKGHDYKDVVTEPTCTASGYTTFTCTRCEATYADDYVPATGHTYSEETVAPTCTTRGYTSYTCKCGNSYTSNYVPATGHTYTTTTVKAGCTTRGYTLRECACGVSYKSDFTPATNHVYEKHVVEATCTTRGYTEYKCSCGMSYKADFVAADGHDYVEVERTATYIKYQCECGKFYVVANS